MILELHVRNLAIVEELRLTLGAGLNVLTGETGAGKSILVDALAAALGGAVDRDRVADPGRKGLAEVVFDLSSPVAARVRPEVEALLAEAGLELEEELLILTREIGERTLARINGRPVPARLLREVGRRLVDIVGQSEHLSLFQPRVHRQLLDRYGGLDPLLEEMARRYEAWQEARARLRELEAEEAALEAEAEGLRFLLERVRAVDPQVGEDEALLAERQRLQNAAQLAEWAREGYQALYAGEPSALDLVDRALDRAERLLELDPRAVSEEVLEGLRAARAHLEGGAEALREYLEALEVPPGRLEEVEARLADLGELKRRWGPTLEEVLARARAAEERLALLENREAARAELAREVLERARSAAEAAARLSAARREAGARLAREVEEVLGRLEMAGARFQVALEREPDPDGVVLPGEEGPVRLRRHGADGVRFLLSANPGQPLLPLDRIASGGESSRIFLGIKAILSEADEIPVLVFDEVDVGVGGRTAVAVGELLWSLGRRHQVLCVTHLPQVAAYADRHLRVEKEVRDGRTRVQARSLAEEEVEEVLALMLAGRSTPASRASARELRRRARSRPAG